MRARAHRFTALVTTDQRLAANQPEPTHSVVVVDDDRLRALVVEALAGDRRQPCHGDQQLPVARPPASARDISGRERAGLLQPADERPPAYGIHPR